MSKLTPFGKLVRKHRIDAGIKMKPMAESLGVSLSYLSAVETGKKNLSDDFVAAVVAYFREHGIDASDLVGAADKSRAEIRIDMARYNDEAKELVAAFARRFPDWSEKKKSLFKDLLMNDE